MCFFLDFSYQVSQLCRGGLMCSRVHAYYWCEEHTSYLVFQNTKARIETKVKVHTHIIYVIVPKPNCAERMEALAGQQKPLVIVDIGRIIN